MRAKKESRRSRNRGYKMANSINVRNEYQRKAIGLLESLVGKFTMWQVWQDFITMAATAICNSVPHPQREAAKWDNVKHLRISTVLGSEQKRIRALNTPADIYIINRENVVWLVDYYKNDWPFDMVVVDEFSSFKSHSAKRFKALAAIRNHISRIVGLTGTPERLMCFWRIRQAPHTGLTYRTAATM